LLSINPFAPPSSLLESQPRLENWKGKPHPFVGGVIDIKATRSCFSWPTTMGFADLSIAEIAAKNDLPIEEVYHLCEQLGIAYKT
jgi:hypothetical protein